MAKKKVAQVRRAPKRAKQPVSKAIRQVTVVHECLALAAGAISEAVSIFEAALGDPQQQRLVTYLVPLRLTIYDDAPRVLRLLRNAQSIVECEMGGAL